jgi:hypothetical protein
MRNKFYFCFVRKDKQEMIHLLTVMQTSSLGFDAIYSRKDWGKKNYSMVTAH